MQTTLNGGGLHIGVPFSSCPTSESSQQFLLPKDAMKSVKLYAIISNHYLYKLICDY
jgi:hypothetical protein